MPETTTPDPAPPSPRTAPRRTAPPPPPGVFRRSAGAARRWLLDTFARERVVGGLKQVAWVTPLTVLIWVYAERAQQHRETVPFTVVARSTNPHVHVTVSEPGDAIVQAVLQGARSRLDDVRGRVGSQAPVIIDVKADAEPGVTTMSVAEVLDRDPRFRGLTWQDSPSSTPVRVGVRVDPMIDQMLPVQVREQDRDRLEAGGAVFTPSEVKVRMPSEVARIARAAHDGQLVVYADLGALTDPAPGRKQTLADVRVFVDGAERAEVKVEPATVAAALTLRDEDQTYTIEQLPVDIQVRGGVTNAYDVECDPATLFNVEVVGPAREIEQLAREDGAAVSAFVRVSKEDAGEDRQKKVSFILPDSVRLHPDSAGHLVRVTVTPRASPIE